VIDLHCHLLPGVDDGPATVDRSVELAAALVADGVRTVAATPHVRADYPDVVPAELRERREALRQAIAAAGIDLEVVAGGELDLGRGLEASEEELRLVSLGQGGRYLLVETPYGPLSSLFEEQLFQLEVRGYGLLLAHPERNPSFQADPERLAQVVARGILLQITAGSLRLGRRSATTRLARGLVERGLAHVLASDAHGAAVNRAPISAGLRAARELAGARADSMVMDAPAAILAGEPPVLPPAASGRRRGLLRRRRA
jgi:protein-tyrosine phosphatase